MSEGKNIQKMKEYILLADRLHELVEEPKARHVVEKLGNMLKTTAELYINERKSEHALQRKLEEFYKYFDSREQAEKYLASAKSPTSRYEPVIALMTSNLLGLAACFAACFSRDISKTYLRKKDAYRKISDNLSKTIVLEKDIEQLKNKTLRILSQNEFASARLIDAIREKISIDDAAAYTIANRPELLAYAWLDFIRDKYAPDLEA